MAHTRTWMGWLLLLGLIGLAAGVSAESTLRNQVAVITGSSSGLGFALAEIAAEHEMRLVLVDIDPGPSEAFAHQVLADGGDAIVLEVDLADPEARAGIIEAAVETYGGVDVLFNNAGILYQATLEQTEFEAARHQFEVNYWAYLDLAQQAIPIMRARNGGTIVNVASIIAHRRASTGLGHYAATKAALVGSFDAAAEELAADGIRVIVASPGGMATNIARHAVGPLAEVDRDRLDALEPPNVAAADIFAALDGDEVHIFPGAVEGP